MSVSYRHIDIIWLNVLNTFQKVNALKRQAESGLEVGAKEEKSAFLTYLLSQTELTPTEVVSNCIDLMLAAVDTVPLRVS